tara:strand:+ start:302 stop:478 length:177 start_codon:yes stop_codon:yes gene_type:complete
MSYLNEVLDDAAARTGGTRYEVRTEMRSAKLLLADAQRYGFETIEEYADAIREYAANC